MGAMSEMKALFVGCGYVASCSSAKAGGFRARGVDSEQGCRGALFAGV